MENFTPWTLFIDFGIISALLLVGKLLRTRLRFIQSLFIPPGLLAGFIGLLLGPNCLDVLPLSTHTGVYAGILIAFVFGCLPFSTASARRGGDNIRRMWAFSQSGMLLQWALGGFLGIFVLSRVWPLNEAFGIAMPAGYCGGHGTAAAVGQAFGQKGFEDMLTLAMTAATVGILASVIIGLVIIKVGARRGYTTYLSDFKDLPHELRTGLLPKEKQESMGSATVSPISIDPLAFNVSLIIFIALGGYCISKGVSYFFPQLELPVFSCAFIFGILLKKVLAKGKASHYFCPQTIGHISGAFTDYLVAFGIASIKLSVVLHYLVPLLVLLAAGLAFTFLFVFFVARKTLSHNWFEKALFTWGWFTGTMAMGIALLRIADPQMKSRCMEEYAVAYLFIAPVEISLITLVPLAFFHGYGILFCSICLLAGLAILFTNFLNRRKR